MCNPHTAPAEASTPDPDRAGPDAPSCRPEWLVHYLALFILFLLKHTRAGRLHRSFGLSPSWVHDRPDLRAGSAQALAASVRGPFGNAIAWMCLRRGIGPGHKDWPELSRAIVAFGGSLKGFRPGMPAWGLQWWDNPEILPWATGEIRPTPAADAMASLLSRHATAEAPPPALKIVPVEPQPAEAPAPKRPALARTATGPPTGPPAGRTRKSITLNQRSRNMAGPAILIRAAATPRLRLHTRGHPAFSRLPVRCVAA